MQNSYDAILENYSKRLISISKRSRTIYFNPGTKFGIDLYDYLKNGELEKFENFFYGDIKEFTFSCKSGIKEINELFNQMHNDELVDDSAFDHIKLTKSDYELLLKRETKDTEIKKMADKYAKKYGGSISEFEKLIELNKERIKESGKNDLYLAYPFVYGKYNDNSYVRAPLFLKKVFIHTTPTTITLESQDSLMLNPVFVMTYLVENEIKYRDPLMFEIDESNSIDASYKLLKNIGVKILSCKENNFEIIKKIKKDEYKNSVETFDNEFVVHNNVALGIFPVSNTRLYDDILSLKETDEVNNMLENFYNNDYESVSFEKEDVLVEEKKLKYITTLDYSQKQTLSQALEGNHIIQGPPGTGKSQVISNIVANLLLDEKKVLVCSEKKTATDVIYNRLGKLSAFAMMLHDEKTEKNKFYEDIKKTNEVIIKTTDEMKRRLIDFNQEDKIEDFYGKCEKYDFYLSSIYYGLNFKEIIENKDKNVEFKEDIKVLFEQFKDYYEFEKYLNDFIDSDLYFKFKKANKEIEKVFYQKYSLEIDKPLLYKLKDEMNKILNIKNNYVKNIKAYNALHDSKKKINLFKRLFKRKEKINDCVKDLINEDIHDFDFFDDLSIKETCVCSIIRLLLKNKINKEDILNNYKIHLAQVAMKNIDLDYMDEYTSSYDSKRKNLFDLMDSKKNDSIDHIMRKVSADIREQIHKSFELNAKYQKLLGECNKGRKKTIKAIVDEYFDVLKIIYPIWIMTPDVVSTLIPLKSEIFDKVIFDEASQLFIEKAVPSIARSKSVVVCGDSKQLRPSMFFETRYEDDEVEEEIQQESATKEKSLLDYAVASNKYKESTLKYHYRCNYKELINFSNFAFYDNELIFATKFEENMEQPIQTININGVWDKTKSVNLEEAKKVVEIVKYILLNRQNNETIGIITLNVNQRNEIKRMLDMDLLEDKDVGKIYLKEKERKNEKTNEDESIFVKNLEGVQGDERDIIIFSIAYSKDKNGRIGSSLGELQRQYGENRLNVAISRAKKKTYIVKSFMGDELTINEDNIGPKYFKKYLQYVDALNNDDKDKADIILNSLVDTPMSNIEKRFDSGFEEEVYDKLCTCIDNKKYEVRTQIKVGSFSIDLGIYDKKSDMYILGIECDGALYHSSPSQIRNDICRQHYLENRGWKIYRIWSTDWWQDKETQTTRLIEYIKNL